ncbi:MAG: dTDP-4-dehydrorhamnose 3,5-epimerase family protein [Bacteroidaceae bacterium]
MNKLVEITPQYTVPKGVKVFRVASFADSRGELMPTFSDEGGVFGENFGGIKQVNIIKTKKHVLRGAHVSIDPQHKLVMVTKGTVTQVLLDLLPLNKGNDATQYIIRHDGDCPIIVLVPPYIANALYSVTKATIVYATDTHFNEDLELSVSLSSPQEWEYGDTLPLQSAKDEKSISVAEARSKMYEHHSN